jgi:Tol biopolymer transport system component
MTTTNSEQKASASGDNWQWPEALKDKPTIDPFPARLLVRWLIPGLVGLVLILVIYAILTRAANRQVLYVSSDGSLHAITANSQAQHSLDYRVPTLQDLRRANVPLMPVPEWSPNGRYAATTILATNGRIQAAIFPASLTDPILPAPDTYTWHAFPGSGWSATSNYAALIAGTDTATVLKLYNVNQRAFLPDSWPIDTRAGLDWAPRRDTLLFTTYTEDMAAPALAIIDNDGNSLDFAPNDGQLMRADGVWSPDGRQIAYVASSTYTDAQNLLWGSLWIANSNGQNLQQLVATERVIAPFWNPRGDFLYFTQVSNGDQFDLYRLAIGTVPPTKEYVGPSTDAYAHYPFNRGLLGQWSPNNRELLFSGSSQMLPETYLFFKPNESFITQIRQVLPVQVGAKWSTQESRFASTLNNEDRTVVFIFDRETGESFSYTASDNGLLVFPTDGWSLDNRSSYLALLHYDGTETHLAFISPGDEDMGIADFDLNTQAGFSWHPNRLEIMATAFDGGITSSLKIFDVVANVSRDFELEDGQPFHADGAWSPNGTQVAYIARDTITDTLALDFVTGSLWVANSDGSSPRELVADGFNLAPVWHRNDEHILFTRFITETNRFELHQVSVRSAIAELLGPGHAHFAEFPFDRQTLLTWSPDGRYWQLAGPRGNLFTLYTTTLANEGATPFSQQCQATEPFTAYRTPTNRAVLLTCPGEAISLHWLDREGNITRSDSLSRGSFPTWQP